MQLSSVPCIIAAALALASIGHTSPVNGPKKGEGLESVDVDHLNEDLGLPHVTVPEVNQARAERKDDDEPEVNQARAERKDDDESEGNWFNGKWFENLWTTG
ncbi:hypothetical protein BBAD15_g9234 [Beauveria bassiana D1-5]|uniref:Uncharacterized protein n=1 Tax=Beauveria bassiana D1-5 TaxID=1245745 RepID=A0A0A2VGM6_BEABA|nr:hypothetical protein BBAD15_g9234 [Beauveria bassiana D1-5]